ncbi:MAG: Rrf2 family transcriptional regulator [Sedimentisphaerales bacterium]|nr:Rrf2 family transcriptional regulator [Sedimentisphaerales bacterium]
MRISRSTGYAMLAVGYIAKHKEEGIILSQTISKKYKIPLEYLLKIMQQLVRANILRSKRGPRGGFSLAKPTKKITMLQVIEAVDGPMISQLNLIELARKEKFSSRAEQAYKKGLDQARNVYDKTKLSDLVGSK